MKRKRDSKVAGVVLKRKIFVQYTFFNVAVAAVTNVHDAHTHFSD